MFRRLVVKSASILICFSSVGLSQTQANPRPSLKETLEWMHNAFPESEGMSAFKLGQTRELEYVDGKNNEPPSCTITLVDHWKVNGKPVKRDTIIDLSLIDPESVQSYREDLVEQGTGVMTFVATNDKKVIIEKTSGREDKPYLTHREFISFIGTDYAERFVKAFKNAVILCGGKASTF